MRVLLAYDDSAGARTARDLVANMDLPDGSTVTMATVLEGMSEVFGASTFATAQTHEADAMLIADLQEMLVTASLPFRPRLRVDCRVLRGRPAASLLAEAEFTHPDLIVTGSRGHGPYASVLLGSVSTELVDHATCPVLVARHSVASRLVIGTDGSPSASHAVDVLAGWRSIAKVPAVVTAVAPGEDLWEGAFGPGMMVEWPSTLEDLKRETLDQARRNADVAAEQLNAAGIAASVVVRRGDAADQLISVANSHGADLIVVGSRGLGTWSRLLLGSVARKVVQHARQSVLVIHQATAVANSDSTPQTDRITAGVR
jgi:nucleotide-binding universal stress UspA family protein